MLYDITLPKFRFFSSHLFSSNSKHTTLHKHVCISPTTEKNIFVQDFAVQFVSSPNHILSFSLSLSFFFLSFLSGTKITHDARFQRESRCSLCVCCICTKLKSSLFFFERIKKQLLFGNYCFCVCKVSSNSKNTCHLIEIKYWFAKIACQTHRII